MLDAEAYAMTSWMGDLQTSLTMAAARGPIVDNMEWVPAWRQFDSRYKMPRYHPRPLLHDRMAWLDMMAQTATYSPQVHLFRDWIRVR